MNELNEKISKFYINSSIDENDDLQDENRVLEESPNGRWNKLATEISIQNLFDFDTAYLAIDTEKGLELAWNEIHLDKLKVKLNNDETLVKKFQNNIKLVLNYLIKLDHSNILTFYGYWYNEIELKWIVITELSTAGSLKKVLDSAKATKTPIKPKTYKRWLNQLLNAMIYIHLQQITIFQGNLNAEKIFIQNNSTIKIAPSLLRLCLNNTINSDINNETSQEKRTINNILKFNQDIIDKDLYSLGLIAIQIFTSHLNLNSVLNSLNLNATNTTNSNIQLIANLIDNSNNEVFKSIFDIDQFNFILNCLKPNNYDDEKMNSKKNTAVPLSPMAASLELIIKSPSRKKLKVEYLLYQPLVNEIYSLKVLSIYSLLVYFQDKPLINNLNKFGRQCKSNTSDEEDSNILNKVTIKIDNENENETHCETRLIENEKKSFSRKVSLNSLANTNNLPKDFFNILEDIKLGCYPRLYSHYINNHNLNVNFIKSIPATNSSLNHKILQQLSNTLSYRRPSNLNLSCSSNNSNSNINIIKEENNNDDVFNVYHKTSNNNIKNDLSNGEQDLDKIHNVYTLESRRIKHETCAIIQNPKETGSYQLLLNIKFDDDQCRTLECRISNDDLFINKLTFNIKFISKLTTELIEFGLVNLKDREMLNNSIMRTLVSVQISL